MAFGSYMLGKNAVSVSEQPIIREIDISLLNHTHNHQFTMYDEERREDMRMSIATNGVLIPIIVRPDVRSDENGKFEILAGNNRKRACEDSGKKTCPCIVKENLSEAEAQMYIVESNLLQRGFSDLKISEQALVIATRHENMFNQDKRSEIQAELETMMNVPQSKLASVGEEYGLSKNSVARLIRINTLVDRLKELINTKELSIRAGVELSYISSEAQLSMYTYFIEELEGKIEIKTAERYRGVFNGFDGKETEAFKIIRDTEEAIILEKEKAKLKKPKKVAIDTDIYYKYFDETMTKTEISDIIEQALKMYFDNV